MSKLLDFGLCGKWQKETLIAHCHIDKNRDLTRKIAPMHLESGASILSVFESEYAAYEWVYPPVYLLDKYLQSDKRTKKFFRLERLVAKWGKLKIVYEHDDSPFNYMKDYSNLLNYIKNIPWEEYVKIRGEK